MPQDLPSTETDESNIVTVLTHFFTDPPHEHEYPGDWVFGGADGCHPGADARYRPVLYTYYNADIQPVCYTTEFVCDDYAVEGFTKYRDRKPVYLTAQPHDAKVYTVPWVYDSSEDEAVFRPPANGD